MAINNDMDRRLKLHEELIDAFVRVGKWLWKDCGFEKEELPEAIRLAAEEHVFFQPPPTVYLEYPCIIYSLNSDDVKYADNRRYSTKNRYSITVIDRDPDSPIPEKVKEIPYCRFDRPYVADNLNHFVFTVYI